MPQQVDACANASTGQLRSTLQTRLESVPLHLVVLGLLLWLPIETWVLRFVPHGGVLLLAPDILSLAAGIVLITALWARGGRKTVAKFLISWAFLPAMLLGLSAIVSGMINHTPALETVYLLRVYLRFLPLALVTATPVWTNKVRRGLPAVVAVALAFQLEVAALQHFFGRMAAEVFWPGTFSLGAVKTAVSTLAGVQGRFVAGTTGHYNILAWYIVLAIAALLAALLSSESDMVAVVRALLTAEVLLAGVFLVLTQSRQVFFLVLLVCVPFVAYLWQFYSVRDRLSRLVRSVNRRRTVAVLALVIVLLGLVMLPAAKLLSQRYTSLFHADYWRAAGDNRGYAIGTIIPEVVGTAPILGFGPGSFGRDWDSATSGDAVAVQRLGLDPIRARYISDVGWASLLGQVGLLGVVATLVLSAGLLRALWRGRSSVGNTVFAGVALLLLVPGMVTGAPLTYKPTSALFWVFAGLVYAASAEFVPGVSLRQRLDLGAYVEQLARPAGWRDSQLDALRGLAIVLVAIGHAIEIAYVSGFWAAKPIVWNGFSFESHWVHALIYTFHMPLFAFLSGWAARFDRATGWKAVKNRALGLLVPYLFWLAAWSALDANAAHSVSVGISTMGTALINPFARNGLWFLYVLFICLAVLIGVRAISNTRRMVVASAILVACLQLFPVPWQPELLGLTRVGLLYPFVVGGLFFPDVMEWVRLRWTSIAALSLVIFAACLPVVWPNAYKAVWWVALSDSGQRQVLVSQFVSASLAYICATAAILFVVALGLRAKGRWLVVPGWLGQRSLGIYAVHFRVMLIVSATGLLALIPSMDARVVLLAASGVALGGLAFELLNRTPFSRFALGRPMRAKAKRAELPVERSGD